MNIRADAHIHLFGGGYRGGSFTSRPGVSIDEVACYESLARDHNVAAALVVGYTGEPWCEDNNNFLAGLASDHDWLKPVACIDVESPPTVEDMEPLHDRGFVGVSLFAFGEQTPQLNCVSHDVWRWLEEHNWLVSVNSDPAGWSAWRPILFRCPRLRLLVSHLGQPPVATTSLKRDEAAAAMQPVTQLAEFPGVCVKLSGFYSLTSPGHGYPHSLAWPYIDQLIEYFPDHRLLWGSDFSPCLDWVTFPQTIDLFEMMPFLNQRTVERIIGGNLLTLLDEVAMPMS